MGRITLYRVHNVLTRYIAGLVYGPYDMSPVDILCRGCTHGCILKALLQPGVEFCNRGSETLRRTADLLQEQTETELVP